MFKVLHKPQCTPTTRAIHTRELLKLLKSVYRCTTVRPWFQDMGAKSLGHATELRNEGSMRMETRTGAAQKEGGVHDMHSYKKVLW